MNEPTDQAAVIELPRYTCHKTVWALKIRTVLYDSAKGEAILTPVDDGYAPFTVSHEYVRRHTPTRGHPESMVGGYYVRYKAVGNEPPYESWSPAGAFEEGYQREPA